MDDLRDLNVGDEIWVPSLAGYLDLGHLVYAGDSIPGMYRVTRVDPDGRYIETEFLDGVGITRTFPQEGK